MKKKLFILFTLVSSLALGSTRDLKMKMVLNKEDVNQILIDIVPENWEEVEKVQASKVIKKEIVKSKEVKKIEQNKKYNDKSIKRSKK